jgi:catechol 2,3-dioxygenase-like lactoylglutathione lyase family enzyme
LLLSLFAGRPADRPIGGWRAVRGGGISTVSIQILQTVPILRIFSVEKAKEFYVGFLGFRIDWEHRFDADAPISMQISLGDLVLHLSEHHGDSCPGSTVFLRVSGLDGYHRELTAKHYGALRPGIGHTFHDSKCMEVIDPFGNRLRFDQAVATEREAAVGAPTPNGHVSCITVERSRPFTRP